MLGGRGRAPSRETRRATARSRLAFFSAAARGPVDLAARWLSIRRRFRRSESFFFHGTETPCGELSPRLVTLAAASAISGRAVLCHEPCVFVRGRRLAHGQLPVIRGSPSSRCHASTALIAYRVSPPPPKAAAPGGAGTVPKTCFPFLLGPTLSRRLDPGS